MNSQTPRSFIESSLRQLGSVGRSNFLQLLDKWKINSQQIYDAQNHYRNLGDGVVANFLNFGIAIRRLRNTIEYKSAVGRFPNYLRPASFTEKMQFRKLFDRNPLFPVFCDKLAVRDYVKRLSPGLKLPKLYWCGSDPADIPFHHLSPPYVIKPTHSSGQLCSVSTREDVDKWAIIGQCRSWLSGPHYAKRKSQWGHLQVGAQILVEEFLEGSESSAFPPDYKLFILAGRVKFISYCAGRSEEYSVTYFDPDWTRLPLCSIRKSGPVPTLREVPRPKRLDDMITIAERLADGIDQLRVDLYEIGDDVVFGELTTYQRSGYRVPCLEGAPVEPFPPRDLDDELGREWQLPEIPFPLQIYRGLLG